MEISQEMAGTDLAGLVVLPQQRATSVKRGHFTAPLTSCKRRCMLLGESYREQREKALDLFYYTEPLLGR